MYRQSQAGVTNGEHRIEGGESEHPPPGRLRRHDEEPVVAARAQTADSPHREAAEGVRDQPLAGRGRIEVSAELAAEAHS